MLLYLGLHFIHWTRREITMELRGLSSCGAVLHAAHDPCDALSHREPMLDPIMAASPARLGTTHTTPTDHLPTTLSTFKRLHYDLEHVLDMVMHSITVQLTCTQPGRDAHSFAMPGLWLTITPLSLTWLTHTSLQ